MTAMTITVANAERVGAEVLANIWAPPPPVDYLAWAEKNVVFSKRESDFDGPYNRELFGYFDEVLRALSLDDPCREVTLLSSAQIGKTTIANIFVGGSIDMDPGDLLYVHPTESNAQRWSKSKLSPMLRGIDVLSKLFPMKSRDGLDSVLYKERVDGQGAIIIGGANSPASLSMVTVVRQVQDDLSKWEMNSAGDPEAQADSRSRGREFAKILKLGTPLVVPGCRTTASYERGSQEELYVPCPHCGHMQVLEWENFLDNLDEDAPEKSHFSCPACGGVIEEHHRRGMIAGHEWRAKNPKAKSYHRSFSLWSAISFLQSFARIAREWLAAKGDPAAEQVFFNDTVGRAYRILGEAPSWEVLRDRALQSDYAVGEIPSGHVVVTAGVDCQLDYVQFQIVAWGRLNRRAIVSSGIFPGHISEPKCQEALDALLKQAWPNAYGRKLGIDVLGIDGNAWTEEVWNWVKKHPAARVIMLRGVGSETAPLLARVKKERKNGKIVRYSRRFFNFATSVLKMELYRNLAKLDPLERGHISLPRGLEDEFYRQMTAESRKPEKNKSGFTAYRWVKDPNQANEGLDTHMQARAAAIKYGVNSMQDAQWDALEATRETPPAAQQSDLEDLLYVAQTNEPANLPVQSKQPSASLADLSKGWKR